MESLAWIIACDFCTLGKQIKYFEYTLLAEKQNLSVIKVAAEFLHHFMTSDSLRKNTYTDSLKTHKLVIVDKDSSWVYEPAHEIMVLIT